MTFSDIGLISVIETLPIENSRLKFDNYCPAIGFAGIRYVKTMKKNEKTVARFGIFGLSAIWCMQQHQP